MHGILGDCSSCGASRRSYRSRWSAWAGGVAGAGVGNRAAASDSASGGGAARARGNPRRRRDGDTPGDRVCAGPCTARPIRFRLGTHAAHAPRSAHRLTPTPRRPPTSDQRRPIVSSATGAAGRDSGTWRCGIGVVRNSRRVSSPSQRAHRVDRATRALSVAIPVFAYI
jgi:hypothetical protein